MGAHQPGVGVGHLIGARVVHPHHRAAVAGSWTGTLGHLPRVRVLATEWDGIVRRVGTAGADVLEQLQHTKNPVGAAGQAGSSRANEESLRRRLALAHQRIAQLRNDNHELRQMLAHAHGELRAANANQHG